jgi:hypothetical protein
MADIEFVLKIPESLAESAREVGILNNERLLTLLQDEVEREKQRDAALQSLSEMVIQLRPLEPKLTQEEIDEEIRAFHL